MASTDLLEELKLNEYYPQKLSFSEAIKFRGRSKKSCHEQYGLEIVRKLLIFDSTAVISVTSEINERLNSRDNTETKTKGQGAADGIRPTQKSNVRPSKTRERTEKNERKLHPMDVLVIVMNCCDDFLRQVLVEKMFANKLSIPILLPDMRNGSYTLLLFALRSLVPEVQDRIPDGSAGALTDTLVDVKNPVVSFIRVGDLQRSKSKLLNELLNFNSFNTFFHRECRNGSAKRSVSNGSIEAAWFQSETATEEEFNCRLFTALNLRGNARDYPKQTQFLCQSSTLVVFMVDSFDSFKELYENVLKDVDLSQTQFDVSYISPKPPNDVDDKYFAFLEDLEKRGVISSVIYDWNDAGKMSDVDFTNDLRNMISKFFKLVHRHSNQIPTYANISQSGKKFGFSQDEDNLGNKSEEASADEFVNLVLKHPPDCKPIILPLQGKPWEKIGKLEREQRGKSQLGNQGEYFIAEKEMEKRKQREIQCRNLNHQNEVVLKFSLKFHLLKEQNLLYYLNSCKIKLDARSRVIISNLNQTHEVKSEDKLSIIELKIANSTIGLEHILREIGQMYEAVISEEIPMKEELKNAPLTPNVIRNFPTIVARLLLKGQSLELLDGDASNVPIIWLKAVLNQIRIITKNAKVFVLSIIGVQSSGKSTLLNALFGLQFPVSAGRCSRGIYCHLVPVDKGSLIAKYDYILVVDTEGLGSSQCSGNSTFRDNELATFAIGLADATIINMKGENWSEIKDILQIAAHGLIRIRKTKAELELMPRCIFVHQNVNAVDAETKNRLGQEMQLKILDKAIKAAGRAEGFTEITKFDQVIKYDPELHSWYFPDFWNCRPPKARISQDYIGKTNELSQYLMEVMKENSSKLTISSFVFRMSDLWNAMLHNEFVLCFRNTQEIISGMILNDKISHEVDRFKSENKLVEAEIRKIICSFENVEEMRAKKESILGEVSDAVEKNFQNMKVILENVIDATDIYAALKEKYKVWMSEIKYEELCCINNEMAKAIGVHMRKLEYASEHSVKELIARLDRLEKRIEETQIDTLNETAVNEFEESWQQLIADNNRLVYERMKIVESEIEEALRGSIQKLSTKDWVQLNTDDLLEILKTSLVAVMPEVTEKDIQKKNVLLSWVMELLYYKSHVGKANSILNYALKNWELQFKNQRDLEFSAAHLEQVMIEVGELLGILRKEREVRPEIDEICLVLPPGCCFTREYTIRFVRFACHYTYNRSLENSKRFISLTDPLADIGERYHRLVSHFRLMTAEAKVNDVSKQIFDYAERLFVRDLGELIKTEVCKEENENPTFKSKRAFLRTILTDLGQRTHNLTNIKEEKQRIFKDFMLYVELGESEPSENFFIDVILKLLKEILTRENKSETNFQKMVRNNVGKIVEKAKNALRQAEAKCKGCAKEYVRIFKDCMNVASGIDFRISILHGFTEAVLKEIDNLYADFLSQANSSFDTLVCKENKARIRPLFEKIMGCREDCPFCSAPCSQSLKQHFGDHRADHYPMGVSGTVNIPGLFANTLEAYDATEEKRRKPRKLALDTCQTLVGTGVDIRTKATRRKCNKWYYILFKKNYYSFKNYKEVEDYQNWDIPFSQDHNASLFWKWFMARFAEELAKHYEALCPEIPEAWQKITWEEAKRNLNQDDLNI